MRPARKLPQEMPRKPIRTRGAVILLRSESYFATRLLLLLGIHGAAIPWPLPLVGAYSRIIDYPGQAMLHDPLV
jgi:hypothetical protein